MKTLYLDCFAGISGDMTLGALVAAGADFRELERQLKKLPVADEFELIMTNRVVSGITGVDIEVIVKEHQHHDDHHNHNHEHSDHDHNHDSHEHNHSHESHEHHHSHNRNLADIKHIIGHAGYSARVQYQAEQIFQTLAEAEAKVHGTTVDQIHFHEVGAVDAIVDITGVAICLDLLGIEQVVVSPMPTFHGFVDCAHGRLPLPAPAVSEILTDVPWREVNVEGELVTPTGAAIVKTLASSFAGMPEMVYSSTGYGCGKNDYGIANLLRAFVGECYGICECKDSVSVLETTIDDMNPQIYDHVINKLLSEGALDAYLTNIQMKKGRPAVQLTVLAEPGSVGKLSEILLRETTSIGLRIRQESRTCLERRIEEVSTEYGSIRVKISYREAVIYNIKPEYEDCLAAAEHAKVPVKQVMEKAAAAASAKYS